MIRQTYVYFRGKIIGPYEKWEIKLFATKYRDFQIYTGNGEWVPYKQWDKLVTTIAEKDDIPTPPNRYMDKTTQIKRYIKRIIFKDHH